MYHPGKMRCLQDSSTSGRATQQVQRPAAVYVTLCKASLGEYCKQTSNLSHRPSYSSCTPPQMDGAGGHSALAQP